MKVVILDIAKPTGSDRNRCKEVRVEAATCNGEDVFPPFGESGCIEAPSCVWGESTASEEEPLGGESSDAKEVHKCFSSKEDDRKGRTQELRKFIDVSKYVVYSSARLIRITVRWRERERRIHRSVYSKCLRILCY